MQSINSTRSLQDVKKQIAQGVHDTHELQKRLFRALDSLVEMKFDPEGRDQALVNGSQVTAADLHLDQTNSLENNMNKMQTNDRALEAEVYGTMAELKAQKERMLFLIETMRAHAKNNKTMIEKISDNK